MYTHVLHTHTCNLLMKEGPLQVDTYVNIRYTRQSEIIVIANIEHVCLSTISSDEVSHTGLRYDNL